MPVVDGNTIACCPQRNGRPRRAANTVTAKLGNGMVRRPADVFVSSRRINPWPAARMTFPSPSTSLSNRRNPPTPARGVGDPRPRRNEQRDRIDQIVALALLDFAGLPAAREAQQPSTNGPLSAVLRPHRRHVAHRFAANTLAITASCSPPFRIVFAWTANTSPWALRMVRIAASNRAGVGARGAARRRAHPFRPARLADAAEKIDKAAFTRADLVEIVGAQLPVDSERHPRELVEAAVDEIGDAVDRATGRASARRP